MTRHGKTQSAIKPEKIRVDEHSAWVHTDIRPIAVPDEGGSPGSEAWEFDMTQYTLAEWVGFLSDGLFGGQADGQMEKQLEAWSRGLPVRSGAPEAGA